ncbi:MAG: hypothetical protein JWR80_8486 [Bradyrhizobium sp.]|nr:hypothetical protein [Bradyrhizobium sp.]
MMSRWGPEGQRIPTVLFEATAWHLSIIAIRMPRATGPGAEFMRDALSVAESAIKLPVAL